MDMGWTKYITDIEEQHEGACFEAAIKAGYTEEQALECDGGELRCDDCPWRGGDSNGELS